MADRSDADIPQVLRRLAPEQIAVDVVLAKRRRILFEAEFPQPGDDLVGSALHDVELDRVPIRV